MANEPVNTQVGLNGIGLTTVRGPAQLHQIPSLKGIGYETLSKEFVQRVTAFKGFGMEIQPIVPPQVLRKSPGH
jgi:hypothetical protein